MSALTVTQYTLIHRMPSEHWIGGVGYGPMTTPGTGETETALEGKPFGFNVGYGFGDTTAASENLLLYDGVAHKLEDVTFHIPPDSYLKPWRITSSDARFEMSFRPILDRCAKTSALIIVTDQHQVFGYLSGTAVLDDGSILKLEDMLCFFEKVHNRY